MIRQLPQQHPRENIYINNNIKATILQCHANKWIMEHGIGLAHLFMCVYKVQQTTENPLS